MQGSQALPGITHSTGMRPSEWRFNPRCLARVVSFAQDSDPESLFKRTQEKLQIRPEAYVRQMEV